MNKSQFIFPAFNAVIFTILFAAIGYLLGGLLVWSIAGIVVGFGIAWLIEVVFQRFSPHTWLFRRRVLLTAMLELVLVVYVIGPFAYVQFIQMPMNYELCCTTPANFGADFDTLSIPSEAGIEIAAWYISSETEDAPTIIISHGAGGNRMGGLWYAEQLYDAGYSVLLYDQRGLGESVGGHPSIGWYDVRDVSYIIDYLIAEYDTNPEKIGAVGISLGGNIVLGAAQLDERLSALWVDGIGPQHYDDFPPPENPIEYFDWSLNYAVLWMLEWQIDFDFDPLNEQMKQLSNRSIMIVAGEAEELEVRLIEVFESELPELTEIWIISGAGHVGGPGLIPEEYNSQLIQFFAQAFSE